MNPFSWKVVCGLLGPLLVALAINKPAETPASVTETLDRFYQARFADLKMNKAGKFGLTRVELDKIKSHHPENGPRLPSVTEHWYHAKVFGNHGKPLAFSTIKLRLDGHSGPMPPGIRDAKRIRATEFAATDLTLKEAINRFKNSTVNSVVVMRDSVRWEFRPVRLSKRECLSCHKNMKLGEPVAVMVYAVAPLSKSQSGTCCPVSTSSR